MTEPMTDEPEFCDCGCDGNTSDEHLCDECGMEHGLLFGVPADCEIRRLRAEVEFLKKGEERQEKIILRLRAEVERHEKNEKELALVAKRKADEVERLKDYFQTEKDAMRDCAVERNKLRAENEKCLSVLASPSFKDYEELKSEVERLNEENRLQTQELVRKHTARDRENEQLREKLKAHEAAMREALKLLPNMSPPLLELGAAYQAYEILRARLEEK